MHRFFRISALAALALGVTALTAQAQRAKTFGVVAGVDFSTLTGCTDANDPTCDLSDGISSKTGFMGGFFVGIPIGAGGWTLEPELLYAQKGAKYDNIDFTGTQSLDYISIPVLIRWNAKPEGGFYVFGGPQLSFNVRCNDSGTDNETNTTYDEDCSTFPGISANTVFSSTLGVGFGKGRVALEGRYDYDWGNAIKYTEPTTGTVTSFDIRNSVWALMLRFTK